MRRIHLPGGNRDQVTPSPSTRPFVQFNASAGGDDANNSLVSTSPQAGASGGPLFAHHLQHQHSNRRGASRSPPMPPMQSKPFDQSEANAGNENEFGRLASGTTTAANSHGHPSSVVANAPTSTSKIINSQHQLPKPFNYVLVTDECIVCNETLPLARFEPCGHQISCADCAARMKKCLQCSVPIERRITQAGVHPAAGAGVSAVASGSGLASGGSAVGSPSNSSSATLSSGAAALLAMQQQHHQMQQQQQHQRLVPSVDRLRYLESKIQEIEETHCCSICMERRRNVAFLCGHGACSKCAETLKTCHMCRKSIAKKINLY